MTLKKMNEMGGHVTDITDIFRSKIETNCDINVMTCYFVLYFDMY